MNKEILIQYADMLQEKEDLARRINKIEKEIKDMIESKYVVSDSVKGTRSDGTYGSIKITGFPLPEYESKKTILKLRKKQLETCCEEIHQILQEVEKYIENVPSSKTRIMFRLYYIDNLTWYQVAQRMHSMFPKQKFTADSCRMRHNRFLEEN